MSIKDLLKIDLDGIFEPVKDLIDELHTSEEEINSVKVKIENIKANLATQMLKSQSDILVAEIKGKSWLQRNWRPITMIVFLILVICDCFGFLKFRLSKEAWGLIQVGLGGYVIGRSGEKVLKSSFVKIDKKKDGEK